MTISRPLEADIIEHLKNYRAKHELVDDADYDALLRASFSDHILVHERSLDRYVRTMAIKHKREDYSDRTSSHPGKINPAIITMLLNNLFEALRHRLERFQNLENANQFTVAQKEKARVALRLEIGRQLDIEFASAILDEDDAQTTAHINKVLSKTKITFRKPAGGSSLDAATVTGTAGSAIDNVTTLLGRAARIAGIIADAAGTASQTMLETIDSVRNVNMFVGLVAAFLYFFTTPVKLANTAYERYKKRKILEDLLNEQARIEEDNRQNGTNNKMPKADRLKLKALQYEIKNQGDLITLRVVGKWAVSGVFLAVSLAAAFVAVAAFGPVFTMAFPLVALLSGSFSLYEHRTDLVDSRKGLVKTIDAIKSTKDKLETIKNNITIAATSLTNELTHPIRNQALIEKLKTQIAGYKNEFKTTSAELRELHLTKHEHEIKIIRLTTNFAKAKSTIGMIVPIISVIGSALLFNPATFFIGVGILVFAGAVLLTMFALQLIHTRQMNKKIAAMGAAEETISLTEDLSTNARLNNALAAAPIAGAQVAEAPNAANAAQVNRPRMTEIKPIRRKATKPMTISGKEEMGSDDDVSSENEKTKFFSLPNDKEPLIQDKSGYEEERRSSVGVY